MPLLASKQKLILTRYVETMGLGNTPVPVAGAIPRPVASVEKDDKDEAVVLEE